MATTAFQSAFSSSTGFGPVSSASIERRLTSVDAAAERLAGELRAVYAECGLQRQHIVAIQRSLTSLDRVGLAPTANDFWTASARPRAGRLTERAARAIEHELSALTTRGAADSALEAALGVGRSRRLDGGTAGDRVSASEAASATLQAAIPDRAEIDDLGQWWQRRLRRAATVKALTTLAGTAAKDAELVVSRYEMQLLESTPWSHGDRLLSAFELANAEIAKLAETRIALTVGDLFSTRRSPIAVPAH